MKLIIILCNQLYEYSPILEELETKDKIILYEHPVYFTDFKYHKMKLVMHRATSKFYCDYLEDNYDNKIIYLEFNEDLLKEIKKYKNLEAIKVYNPIDHKIIKEFINISKKTDTKLEIIDNPGFICTIEDYNEYLKNNKNKNPYFHHSFYIWGRKKYNLLMNKDKPLGDKWSFDTENRIPFPKNYKEDNKEIILKLEKNDYVKEAKTYVNKYFKDNHGLDEYYLPIDFKGAKKHFEIFIKKRLNNFGPYEDAVSNEVIFGNHSVLSPLINIGLITPKYILEKVLEYYKKSKPKIQSVEGYIRQLFWREFCVLVYLNKNKELETGNFFNHKKDINKSWYDGTTGIQLINDLINKALKYGFLHHIERLMYIGNFMILTNINPKESYKWFMELFIDSYPWVMSPNVYGMSQHSSGPIMMKRPYFSSSNYIDKMSTYKKKKNIFNKIKFGEEEYEWYEIWDSLYYNFINDNKKYLGENYSTANNVKIWNSKSNKEKENLLVLSKKYLSKY